MATVLIVDDEPSILFLVRIALEVAGYEVVEAANGAAALELVTRGPAPDAIVTDVMMPVMDGRELLVRLRSDPKTKMIPVIVHSSVENPPEEATAVAKKPVSPDDLAELVRHAIDRSGG